MAKQKIKRSKHNSTPRYASGKTAGGKNRNGVSTKPRYNTSPSKPSQNKTNKSKQKKNTARSTASNKGTASTGASIKTNSANSNSYGSQNTIINKSQNIANGPQNNRQGTSQSRPVSNASVSKPLQSRPVNNVRTKASYGGNFLTIDTNKDYQALKQDAERRGDYASAEKYEAMRNAKIDYLNQMGQNDKGYSTTDDYVRRYTESMGAGGAGTNNEGGNAYVGKNNMSDGIFNKNGIRYKKNPDGSIMQDVGRFSDGSTHWYKMGDGVNERGEFIFKDPDEARKKAYDDYIMSGSYADTKNYDPNSSNEERYRDILNQGLVDEDYVSSIQNGNVGGYSSSIIDRYKEAMSSGTEPLERGAQESQEIDRGSYDREIRSPKAEPFNIDLSYLDDDYARRQRENYIARERAISQSQDLLRSLGLTGGMAESTISSIQNQYLNNRLATDEQRSRAKQEALQDAQRRADEAAKERYKMQRDDRRFELERDKLRFNSELAAQKYKDQMLANNRKNWESTAGAYYNDFQAQINKLKDRKSQGHTVDENGISIDYQINYLNMLRNEKTKELQKLEREQAEKDRKFGLDEAKFGQTQKHQNAMEAIGWTNAKRKREDPMAALLKMLGGQ